MKRYIFIVFSALFLLSCGSKNHEEYLLLSESFDEYEGELEELMDRESIELSESIPRMIIKNGSLELEVRDLGTEKRKMDSLVKSAGGYYEHESLRNTSSRTIYQLTIRIPAERFGQFIAMIERGGNEITHKSVEAKDVTEEYIDLETRLANKRKYMTRYQELLKEAKNMQEILEIQERIRNLEEEIESTMGRLKYLSNQVTYSTLNLTMSQAKTFRYSSEKRADSKEKLKQSVYGGWFRFVDFLYLLLYNWVLIMFILTAVTIWQIRRRRRRSGKGIKE